MLVDTHAHLDFPEFYDDLPAVLDRAHTAGVSHIITVGTDFESSRRAIQIAEEHDNVYASVGIHPHEATRLHDSSYVPEMAKMLAHKKVVAIGEIGLDYYRSFSDHADQQQLFKTFLRLSQESALPFIFHCRDAYNDFFSFVRQAYAVKPFTGVLHCFSGNERALIEAVALGLYISFTGVITYKKSDVLRQLVQQVPDDRLLIETDAPYLAPQRVRGKRNEPAYVRDTAEMIAEIRGVRLTDIARITTRNCNSLFGIPAIDEEPQIVYKIRDAVYINTTNRCSNVCTFCVRNNEDIVKGHNLRITRDPSAYEVLTAIAAFKRNFSEVVFCGFGEPFIRLDFIKEVAGALKKEGIRVRVDTNGQGNLIHDRDILPECAGLIDALCVSLNAPTEELYNRLCQPTYKGNVYQAVCTFIKEARAHIPEVQITFLDLPEVDHDAMQTIGRDLGVSVRVRHYNRVG